MKCRLRKQDSALLKEGAHERRVVTRRLRGASLSADPTPPGQSLILTRTRHASWQSTKMTWALTAPPTDTWGYVPEVGDKARDFDYPKDHPRWHFH